MSWSEIWHGLRGDSRVRWARWFVMLLVIMAIFGDFVANEKPVYCKVDGESYFPIAHSVLVDAGLASWPDVLLNTDWGSANYQRVLFTLIPYSPGTIDAANANFVSPFGPQSVVSWRHRHWLGTDSIGRDVLAGLIRGCRVALLVGLLSMALAMLLGLPIGVRAGYFGDSRKSIPLLGLITWFLMSLLCLWYMWQMIDSVKPAASLIYLCIGALVLFVGWGIEKGLRKWFPSSRMVNVPVDSLTMRAVEVIRSVPAFFLLFALLGMIQNPKLIYLIVIIGVLRSPTIIRYVRAEAMKLRDKPYIDSARILGLSSGQIIRRHIVPNAIGPVMITVAFGIGGAVLLESGLSFLGIGLSIDQMSWGRLLSEARSNFSAWWLALLPGLAIFLTVAAFNRIGETLTRLLS